MTIKGRVLKLGDHIDTDLIIPGKYLTNPDPKFLASHVLEGVDANFAKKIHKGDILVCGINFGCGSSREHAPIAIKQYGIGAVVAQSFARIFYRNAINIGLPIFECKDTENIEEGSIIQLDETDGTVFDEKKQKKYTSTILPKFIQNIIDEGGLVNYINKTI